MKDLARDGQLRKDRVSMGKRVDLALDRLLVGSPLRKRWIALWVVAALVAALLMSLAVILLAVGSLQAGAAGVFLEGLVFSAVLSIVPIIILRYLDRRERESPWLLAIAILWGALIATGMALPLNTGIIMAVGRWLEQYPEIGEYLGPHGAMLLGAPLAAPSVEEATKALGVVLLFAFLRAEFDNMRDGFVSGPSSALGLTCWRPRSMSRRATRNTGSRRGGFSSGHALRFSASAATRCSRGSLALSWAWLVRRGDFGFA
jgi:PrsW family intramembrane metalloprotease